MRVFINDVQIMLQQHYILLTQQLFHLQQIIHSLQKGKFCKHAKYCSTPSSSNHNKASKKHFAELKTQNNIVEISLNSFLNADPSISSYFKDGLGAYRHYTFHDRNSNGNSVQRVPTQFEEVEFQRNGVAFRRSFSVNALDDNDVVFRGSSSVNTLFGDDDGNDSFDESIDKFVDFRTRTNSLKTWRDIATIAKKRDCRELI